LGCSLGRKFSPPYKVIKIIDGDTIQVKIGFKIEIVRMLGVDTPEIESLYSREECFGKESSQKTKELLEGKKVFLLKDPEVSDRDKYGRLLRYVFLEDGEFINADLIERGFAFNYIYQPFQFMDYFARLEKKAREKRAGLWSEKCEYYFRRD
jgi:micrococcal nuclease